FVFEKTLIPATYSVFLANRRFDHPFSYIPGPFFTCFGGRHTLFTAVQFKHAFAIRGWMVGRAACVPIRYGLSSNPKIFKNDSRKNYADSWIPTVSPVGRRSIIMFSQYNNQVNHLIRLYRHLHIY